MSETPNLGLTSFTEHQKIKRDDWNKNFKAIESALQTRYYQTYIVNQDGSKTYFTNVDGEFSHSHKGTPGEGPKLAAYDVTLNSSVLKSKTVEEALNEIKSDISDQKINLVNAVGLPVLTSDTFTKIAERITLIKNGLADAITAEGIHCVGTESLDDMAIKIGQIHFDGVELISNAEPSNVLSGKTYIAHTALLDVGTKIVTDQGVKTYTGSTTSYTIPAGLYRNGSKLPAQSTLVPENIVSGKNIYNVAGSYVSPKGIKVGETILKTDTKLQKIMNLSQLWNYDGAGVPESDASLTFFQDILEYPISPYNRHSAVILFNQGENYGYGKILNSFGQKVLDIPGDSGGSNGGSKGIVRLSGHNDLTIYKVSRDALKLECYNKSGTFLWQYNTSAIGSIYSVVPLNDGTVVILTQMYSSSTGNRTYRMIRVNYSGTYIWSVILSDESNSIPHYWTLYAPADKTKVYVSDFNINEVNLSTGAKTQVFAAGTYPVTKMFFSSNGNWYIQRTNGSSGVTYVYDINKSLVWSKPLSIQCVLYNTGSALVTGVGGIHLITSLGIDHGPFTTPPGDITMTDYDDNIYSGYGYSSTGVYSCSKSSVIDTYKVVMP